VLLKGNPAFNSISYSNSPFGIHYYTTCFTSLDTPLHEYTLLK
jgi:hypothetical protein